MTPTSQVRLDNKSSLLEIFCYFDIFHYPLTFEELVLLSSKTFNRSDLQELIKSGIVCQNQEYYHLIDSPICVENRKKGNVRALKLENKAIDNAMFIGQFPFVRSVSISGSMSKGYLSEDADIDYFIITDPGRLWIARTLLILYKKLFLFNSNKYFCVNYFIDTDNLAIEEKNQFTATEVVTLRNVYGPEVHRQFERANQWAFSRFPNYETNHLSQPSKSKWFKRLTEKLLSGRLGDQIDIWCLMKTINRWRSKFGGMEEVDFKIAFKSRRSISKHHPNNFQKKVLEALSQKKVNLSVKHNISFD